MKLCLIILLITFGITQAAIITAYQGSCSECIGNGYNYCLDNSTCVDNRPQFCFTLYDKPMSCPSTPCTTITIADADLYSQKEVLYMLAADTQCTVPIVHTLTDKEHDSYWFVLIDSATTNRYNLSISSTPTQYSHLSPYYQGWRQTLNSSYATTYLFA